MGLLFALLVMLSFAVSVVATYAAMLLGRKLRALDGPGMANQVKTDARSVPNTGGIGIFLGIMVPMVLGLIAAWSFHADFFKQWWPQLPQHIAGLRTQSSSAISLLLGIAVLHVMGLIDDRKPLGPRLKLAIMVCVSIAVIMLTDTRLLTLFDARVGGAWLSIGLTVFWVLVITNAMNFMDNMDGLSAGVAAIAAGMLLASALVNGQWFIAAMLSLLLGASLGFLVFNFPPAKIFMGDSGSLVLGFLLAILSVRITYHQTSDPTQTPAWYVVLTPVAMLAVPLYDFASVVVIRLKQERSPLVGDLQHFSHRLTWLGLSRRSAVLVIYGIAAATGISGIVLSTVKPWQALLICAQILLLLGVLSLFEIRSHSETLKKNGSEPQ